MAAKSRNESEFEQIYNMSFIVESILSQVESIIQQLLFLHTLLCNRAERVVGIGKLVHFLLRTGTADIN